MTRLLPLLPLLLLAACQEPQTADDAHDPCGPSDDLEHAANTTGAAAKTGGTTAWEGIKTAGKAVGGLFEGGSDEAKKEWEEGKQRTRDTANSGASETRDAANAPRPCNE